MRLCPGIIAAVPREVKALVKGWERREVARHVWVWTNGSTVVACAGMGAARAELAVRAAMAAMPVTDLLSVGLAGACDEKLLVGDVVRAGVLIDEATGDRYDDSQYRSVLVSMNTIASMSEKCRLRSKYSADAVDMEAATVARLARVNGVSFHAIKTISDGVDFELEGLSQFATADGQFREGAFALHAAMRPAMWSKVIALGRNSNVALAALTQTLRDELDWYEKRA